MLPSVAPSDVPPARRPEIRLRKAPTLPPVAPPPRRSDPPPARLAMSAANLPLLNATPDPDWLDETQVREEPAPAPRPPAEDGDISVPGITEVKSVLTFNRRRRTGARLDATTQQLDRRRLLRDAGFLPSVTDEDSPTAPGGGPPSSGPLPSFPSAPSITLQILPTGSTPVLGDAFAQRAPVLELIPDSFDPAVAPEPETVTDLGQHARFPARAAVDVRPGRVGTTETSDPGLQTFARNEDWGREAYPSESPAARLVALETSGAHPAESSDSADGPVWNLTGRELAPAAEPRLPPLIRFADSADVQVVPRDFSDISFSDDISLHPDMSGSAPHAPPAQATPGFAPVSPATRLVGAEGAARTAPIGAQPYLAPVPAPAQPQQGFAPPTFPPPGAFVPRVESPRAYPTVGSSLPVLPSSSANTFSPRFGFPGAPGSESGQVSTSSDVSRHRGRERTGWTAPLLFLAALVAALAGGFFFLLREPAPATPAAPAAPATPVATVAMAPAPTVTTPTPVATAVPVTTAAPIATAAPAAATAAPATAAATPTAAAARATPAPAAAPRKAAPRPAPPAPRGATPAAAPAAPTPDEGPKALPAPPAPAAAESPAAPAMQGLGDLLNGAL